MDPHTVSRELFGERGRRAAVLEAILIAVPGTGHAAVDDAALSDRAVLVRAEIGERADLVPVAKNRDALSAGRADDPRRLVRDGARRARRNPVGAIGVSADVEPSLAP